MITETTVTLTLTTQDASSGCKHTTELVVPLDQPVSPDLFQELVSEQVEAFQRFWLGPPKTKMAIPVLADRDRLLAAGIPVKRIRKLAHAIRYPKDPSKTQRVLYVQMSSGKDRTIISGPNFGDISGHEGFLSAHAPQTEIEFDMLWHMALKLDTR